MEISRITGLNDESIKYLKYIKKMSEEKNALGVSFSYFIKTINLILGTDLGKNKLLNKIMSYLFYMPDTFDTDNTRKEITAWDSKQSTGYPIKIEDLKDFELVSIQGHLRDLRQFIENNSEV